MLEAMKILTENEGAAPPISIGGNPVASSLPPMLEGAAPPISIGGNPVASSLPPMLEGAAPPISIDGNPVASSPPPLWGGWGGGQLVLAGEGDLSLLLHQKSKDLGLDDRVLFLGYVKPEDLKNLTAKAWLGLNLLENRGLSYYYSLANKFFDCVQAGVPVLTMDFPEYRALNEQHEVAILLEELSPESVATAIRALLNDTDLYEKLRQNCLVARQEWNWEQEQKTLLEIWGRV